MANRITGMRPAQRERFWLAVLSLPALILAALLSIAFLFFWQRPAIEFVRHLFGT